MKINLSKKLLMEIKNNIWNTDKELVEVIISLLKKELKDCVYRHEGIAMYGGGEEIEYYPLEIE